MVPCSRILSTKRKRLSSESCYVRETLQWYSRRACIEFSVKLPATTHSRCHESREKTFSLHKISHAWFLETAHESSLYALWRLDANALLSRRHLNFKQDAAISHKRRFHDKPQVKVFLALLMVTHDCHKMISEHFLIHIKLAMSVSH